MSCSAFRSGRVQVETISDQYMLVSGAPSECRFHANHIAEVALAFREAANGIPDPSRPGESLQLQLGLRALRTFVQDIFALVTVAEGRADSN